MFMVMKKIALSILVVLFAATTLTAQQKVDAADNSVNLLEGTWTVENADLLPTYLQDDYKKYLKAKMVFGSGVNNFFGNTDDAEKNYVAGKGHFYNYNKEAKTISIFDAELNGIEYRLISVEKNRLVFSVPNKELNNYIDLVYTRVTEEKAIED